MKSQLIYSKAIETPLGSVLVCSTIEGICQIEFADHPRIADNLGSLSRALKSSIVDEANVHLDLLENQFSLYFEGKLKTFTVPLYLVGTDFQKKVWTYLLSIDYGKVVSYSDQAQYLGNINSLRAVASANGANRIPVVVPCHRVVGSNGSLTGYSGGLWRKQFLLNLESGQQQIGFNIE